MIQAILNIDNYEEQNEISYWLNRDHCQEYDNISQ